MNKTILTLIFGFLFIIPLVSANSIELSCSNEISYCAEINYSFTSAIFRCESGSFFFSQELNFENGFYCAGLSAETMGTFHGYEISCEIIVLNESTELFSEQINYNFSCPPPICGNLIIEDGEECDSGNETLACIAGYDEFCSYCSSDCQNITIQGDYCGDLTCQEEFENWTNCNIDCPKPAICGDGIIDSGEECDGGSCCLSDCTERKYKEKSVSSITKYEMKECISDWDCSSWSSCQGDIKTRKCYDLNQCDYAYNMPPITSGCEISLNSKVEESSFNFFPWMFVFLVLLLVLLILLQLAKK